MLILILIITNIMITMIMMIMIISPNAAPLTVGPKKTAPGMLTSPGLS